MTTALGHFRLGLNLIAHWHSARCLSLSSCPLLLALPVAAPFKHNLFRTINKGMSYILECCSYLNNVCHSATVPALRNHPYATAAISTIDDSFAITNPWTEFWYYGAGSLIMMQRDGVAPGGGIFHLHGYVLNARSSCLPWLAQFCSHPVKH